MALMVLSVVILVVQTSHSETVYCDQQSKDKDCECTQPGECIMICNEDDKCAGSDVELTCYDGYPCEIQCGGEANCIDVYINAETATHLNLTCSGKDSCKGSNTVIDCGTGDCFIQCTHSKACEDFNINENNARSLQCTGNHCPNNPANYSPNPTTSPTKLI